MVNLSIKSNCKKIIFRADDYALSGMLHLPPIQQSAFVIGAHGLYSDSNSPKQIELAQSCNARGLAYFRFDHRGCGKSQGDFYEVTSLEARYRDVAAAIDMLQARSDLAPKVGLFGSSLGGAACLLAASRHPVCALVTYAAPVHSACIAQSLQDAAKEDYQMVQLMRRLQFDLTQVSGDLHTILVVHGTADEVVPPTHAMDILRDAGNPKNLQLQPQGDHRMSNPIHQKAFMKAASEWFRTHLTTVT